MERLTFEVHDGGIFVKESDVKTFTVEDEIMHTGNAVRKLAEYEDIEEQGKLLKLPCAVGDDVWYISERVEKQGRKKVEISFVDHGAVDNITLGHMMIPQITVCNDENVWTTFDGVEDFGKTVFLTREEAEAALKLLMNKLQHKQCEECKCNSCSYKEECCPDCEGLISGCEEYLAREEVSLKEL